jgi:hypothetical protein
MLFFRWSPHGRSRKQYDRNITRAVSAIDSYASPDYPQVGDVAVY